MARSSRAPMPWKPSRDATPNTFKNAKYATAMPFHSGLQGRNHSGGPGAAPGPRGQRGPLGEPRPW
eukprot:15444953-Alexandrium_andersonii.AAC.1